MQPPPPIHRFDSLPSTMRTALEFANAGCLHGTVVVAGQQTAGQGRLGRTWLSPPGSGLYMSQVIRLAFSPDSLPLITLATGLAVAESLASVADVTPDLRWPNDVLLSGKKCAGILVQLHDLCVVLGIGVNLTQRKFPPEISATATSLLTETGKRFDSSQVLTDLLPRLQFRIETLASGGRDLILQLFENASSYVRGKVVEVIREPAGLTGVTDGLNPQGFLYLRDETGVRHLILAGGIRPLCS